jgi:transcriptional regulator GlxA family with amidase domain
MPFELFTVSGSKNPIHTSGGMTVTPDYTFDNAPPARIVVVGAQAGDPKLAAWLRRRIKESDVVMSVCTGAFQLGKAGLLDGKQATTHHEHYDQCQKSFPKAKLMKGSRFVQSDGYLHGRWFNLGDRPRLEHRGEVLRSRCRSANGKVYGI